MYEHQLRRAKKNIEMEQRTDALKFLHKETRLEGWQQYGHKLSERFENTRLILDNLKQTINGYMVLWSRLSIGNDQNTEFLTASQLHLNKTLTAQSQFMMFYQCPPVESCLGPNMLNLQSNKWKWFANVC